MRWEWNDGEGPAGGLLKPKPPDMNVCCRISKYYKESIENNLDIDALVSEGDQKRVEKMLPYGRD